MVKWFKDKTWLKKGLDARLSNLKKLFVVLQQVNGVQKQSQQLNLEIMWKMEERKILGRSTGAEMKKKTKLPQIFFLTEPYLEVYARQEEK